jgi:hypothetical protein
MSQVSLQEFEDEYLPAMLEGFELRLREEYQARRAEMSRTVLVASKRKASVQRCCRRSINSRQCYRRY